MECRSSGACSGSCSMGVGRGRSPSGRERRASATGARIGSLRELTAVELLHHLIAVVLGNHALDLLNLMAPLDREPGRVRAHTLVLLHTQLERGRALGVAALTQELDGAFTVTKSALDGLLDSFVDLTEKRLVPRQPLKRYGHGLLLGSNPAGNGDLLGRRQLKLVNGEEREAPKPARPTEPTVAAPHPDRWPPKHSAPPTPAQARASSPLGPPGSSGRASGAPPALFLRSLVAEEQTEL